jgi:integrase
VGRIEVSPRDGAEILDEIMERMSSPVAVTVAPAKPKGLRGQGGVYQRGRTWWIRYSVNGKEIRESSKSEKLSAATSLLAARKKQIAKGKFMGLKEERCTVAELLDAVVQDHKINGRRAVATLMGRVETLKVDLGSKRAVDLRVADVSAYTARRLAGKSKRGTTPSVALINRELALLRRAFNLGVEEERLATAPHIRMLAGERIREGFVEPSKLAEIVAALPEPINDVAAMAGLCGWRKQELLSLRWEHVDLATGLVTLARENSKTGEPRTLPLTAALRAIIDRRHAAEQGPWVFHRAGERIDGFRKAWASACKKAGVPGLVFHDLRRTASVSMGRAGVPVVDAMRIMGHQTDSMFRRYRITNEQDSRRALELTERYLAATQATQVQ